MSVSTILSLVTLWVFCQQGVLSLYVLICPFFDSHKNYFLAILLFRLPQQIMCFRQLLALHKQQTERTVE